MEVEINNAKEEVKEIIERCIRCGMCNSICPVLRIIRKEHYSPRGKMIMFNKGIFEKIVYSCALCKACEENCPLNIKLCDAFIRVRKILVLQKRELEANSEMIENLKKSGNIFGIK